MRKNSSQWEVDAIEVGEHRPRQFEFHPTVRDRLLCGTIRGDLLILSTEHGVVKHFRGGYAKRNGDAILGLCWFNTKPNLFVSGSASGVVKCGNWQAESDPSDAAHTHVSSSIVKTFEPSSQLTSVSLNCLDEKLLTSGYSRDIRIDDVETGTTVHKLADVHTNHINISRFAHHSPTIFATSSFDRTAKLWDMRTPMTQPIYSVESENALIVLSFSPDDQFLLAAAADNEVTQYLVVDGSTHMRYRIPQTTLSANYTRAYYSATGAYVFAGASEEPILNVLCSKSGDLVARAELYENRKHTSLYIQSLRGDPNDDRQLCVLVNYRDVADRDVVRVRFGIPGGEGDDQQQGQAPVDATVSAEDGSEVPHAMLPSAQLARDLHTALQQQQHTDASITAHSQSLACHAFILEARAPAIAVRLHAPPHTPDQSVADLTDLIPAHSVDVLPAVLRFLYTDDVAVADLRCICIDRLTIPDEEKRAAKEAAQLRTVHAADSYAYDASSFEQYYTWAGSSMDEREMTWCGPWALHFVAVCDELLHIACALRLSRLQSIMDDFLIKSITTHALPVIVGIATRRDRPELLLRCQKFVAHRMDFLEHASLPQLPETLWAAARQERERKRMVVALGEPTNLEEQSTWFADSSAPAVTKVPSFVGHTASPPLGDTVLLIGGRDHSHYHSLRCIYAYNVQTRTWSRIDAHGVAPPSILYHTCGTLEQSNPRHVFICEGKPLVFQGGRSDSSVYVLDTLTMRWQAPSVSRDGPTGRTRHSMVALYHEELTSLTSPAPQLQQHQQSVGSGRSSFSLSSHGLDLNAFHVTPPNEKYAIDVSLHTRFVLFGGYCLRQRTLTNDVNVLVYHRKPISTPHDQPQQGSVHNEFYSHGFAWVKPEIRGDRPTPRFSHSAGTAWFPLDKGGPRMIVFGGADAHQISNDVLSLQMTSLRRMQWESVTVEGTPPHPRYGHEMVRLPDKHSFLIIGGLFHEARCNDLHILNVTATLRGITATWSEVLVSPPSPGLRENASAVFTQETLFVFGGSVRETNDQTEVEPHVHMLDMANLDSAQWEPVRSYMYAETFDTIFHRKIPTLHADLGRALAKHAHPDLVLQVLREDASPDVVVDIPANKLVLAARSPTLQVMLDSSMIESTSGTIMIQDVQPEVLRSFLQFLYTDTLYCEDEQLIDLLMLANRYNVHRLVQLCEGLACEAIDDDNCFDLLLLADSLFLRTLQLGCQGYIIQHWQKFAQSERFAALPPHLRQSTCDLREDPHQAYHAQFSA